MVVLDFLSAPGSATAIKATGAQGVILYTKAVTSRFYKECVDAGLGVALNCEHKETSWRGGHETGRRHGAHARAVAREVGHRDDRPIFASYDYNIIDDADFAAAIDYQKGFNDGAGGFPQSAYAIRPVLERMLDLQLITIAWQVCSTGYNGNKVTSPRAALRQHCQVEFAQWPKGTVDVNDVHADDWGQHDVVSPSGSTTRGVGMTTFALTKPGLPEDPRGFNPIVRVSDDRERVEAWYANAFDSYKAHHQILEAFGIQAYTPHAPLRDIARLDDRTLRLIGLDGTTFPLAIDAPWTILPG